MERFDHFFVNITQEAGGLEGLFHSLFSFLLRRTDFFVESEPGDKMGFPPGVNEKMLLNVFNLYRKEYYKNNPQKSKKELEKKYKEYLQKEQEQKQNLKEKEKKNSKKKEIIQTSTEKKDESKRKNELETGKNEQKPIEQKNEYSDIRYRNNKTVHTMEQLQIDINGVNQHLM